MLHRAYKIYNERTSFYREINRLKQLFIDNNYPMKIVDIVISRLIFRSLDDANANHTEQRKYTPLILQSSEQQLQTRRKERRKQNRNKPISC